MSFVFQQFSFFVLNITSQCSVVSSKNHASINQYSNALVCKITSNSIVSPGFKEIKDSTHQTL
jgi:hypothetical protein